MAKRTKSSNRLQRKADRKRKARDAKRKELRMRGHRASDPGPRPSNEVSPVVGMSADEYVKHLVAQKAPSLSLLRRIREEKARSVRPRPSARLIGEATRPPGELRARLLDKVAELVDENVFGRSEMCAQFAALLAKALRLQGITAESKKGRARYIRLDGQWFTWDHAWVEYDDCVIDGNVDTMRENPLVDHGVDPPPFWGRRDEIPDNRQYDFSSCVSWRGDEDVEAWWPRLAEWLRDELGNTQLPAGKIGNKEVQRHGLQMSFQSTECILDPHVFFE